MIGIWDQFNESANKGYDAFKAKITFYNGVKFDSHLEAKTAEALDRLGIKWLFHEYTFRGGMYPYGVYTPDFCLPDLHAFVEVAGVFDDRHRGNVNVLAKTLEGDGTVSVVDGSGDVTDWLLTPEGDVVDAPGASWLGGRHNLFQAAGM